MNNMEIELRAKIADLNLLEKKMQSLQELKEKKIEERQVDIYFKHDKEIEERMVIRIRKNYKNNQALLTFKGKSKHKDDIAWEDFDTPIEDSEKLEKFLINNGYEYFCLIDKVRQSFSYKDFEINIDNIRDLGLFVEIEKQGDENEVENIKKEIIHLLNLLGIDSESIITKGYVQLVRTKMF